MNMWVVIGIAVLFVVYSAALIGTGMAMATYYNRQAWKKYYEGRGER